MPKEIVHYDILGKEIKVGNAVAYPDGTHLAIGTVIKLNKIMVKVKEVVPAPPKYSWQRVGSNKYPNDIVVLEGAEVTMYILRNSHAK